MTENVRRFSRTAPCWRGLRAAGCLAAAAALGAVGGCAAGSHERAAGETAGASAAGPIAGQADFTPLFNGRDLDGWVVEHGGKFAARDGVLVVDGGTGWLRSAAQYDDFVLRIEFRFLEPGANSGIFVRTGPTSHDDENGWPDNGYQIQCMDTVTGEHPLATMIPYGAPPFEYSSDLDAIARAYRPTGEWNTYEITCAGDQLSVALNGVKVTTAAPIENRTGHVGIQGEHGHLEFRAIGIRRLD